MAKTKSNCPCGGTLAATEDQRSLITDMCKVLGIRYSGSFHISTAQAFIAQHYKRYRAAKQGLRVVSKPTLGQLQAIEAIQKVSKDRFSGSTESDARKFIYAHREELKASKRV